MARKAVAMSVDDYIATVNEWAAKMAGEWDGPSVHTWDGNAGFWLCAAVKDALPLFAGRTDRLHPLALDVYRHYAEEANGD